MPSRFQLITELYDQTVQSVTGDYSRWTGFLRAACYNYKCPFDEQILIYAQRPDATAVLEMNKWNKQFGRWVNRGAKSIAVFGDDGQNSLKLYFDVSDTHETNRARPLPIWTMHPDFEPAVIETLENTFGNLSEKETLVGAVRSAAHNAVVDNLTDYLQDLSECREDSLLEELDDLNLEVFYRDALEVSVAYMLLTRLGYPADECFSPDEFFHVYEFNTPPTINALGIATSDIAEMGLREISRTVMQAQREQFFANREKSDYDKAVIENDPQNERSGEHGDHLQDAGRLSGAQPDDAAGSGRPSGQVRPAAEGLFGKAQTGAVHQPENHREADGASGGDRTDRPETGGAERDTDGKSRGRDGGTESRRSAPLDGPDEQLQTLGRGSSAERSDLRITEKEPTAAGSYQLPAVSDAHSYTEQVSPRYQVAAYHHIENGFDDKLDYHTLERAEEAEQGYVNGTMEADGFAYDGAAVYDTQEKRYLRVYGDYPDEKAQAQAAEFAQEQEESLDTAAPELPPFLDMQLIEANLFG